MSTTSTHGASFSSEDYAGVDVYKRDLQLLATQWTFVAHISQFPTVGAFSVHQICGESIVLVRTEAGVRGYFNFCRHRGSQICTDVEGVVDRFVCPYHGWTYGLDGELTHARAICLSASQHARFALKPVGVMAYEGLIFVSIEQNRASDFSAIVRVLNPLVSWHGLAHAKIACRRSYPTKANWKLVVENFLECFHCFPNHPELCAVYSHPKLAGTLDPVLGTEFVLESVEWERTTRAMGHPTGGIQIIDASAKQFCVAFRMPIRRGFSSLSPDGSPLAPLMGNFEKYDGGETFGFVGPLLHFSLANDHAMLIRINPVDPVNSEVELTWLVDAGAVEGEDFDCNAVSWLWDATVKQDRALVERAQAGVNSRFYVPGPYTDLEVESSRFAKWYRGWHDRHGT